LEGTIIKILRRIFSFAVPYWYIMLAGLTTVTVVSLLGLVTPQITRWVIDYVIGGRHFHLLAVGALGVVGVAALRGVLTYVQRYSMEWVAQRVIYDLRNRLYQHLQHLSFGFYDKAQTGQLMSRLTVDVQTTDRFLGFGIIQMTTAVVTFVSILVILFTMNWRLTLVAMTTVPLLIHAVGNFARRVRPLYQEIQQQMAVLTIVLQENITGMRVVKSFARERYEMEKFSKENWAYLDKNLVAVRRSAFWVPYMNFLSGLATALVVWFGGREVIAGRLSLGGFVAFNSYMVQLLMPIRMMGFLVNLATRTVASGQRILEVLDTRSEVRDRPGAYELGRVEGRVRFEEVTFGYDSKQPVLDRVSLSAEPGQIVAILGGTGSGKSTIINLIPRFYDVTGGRVTIDGHDVREVTLESLRRQVGLVSQDIFLFATTIKENIAYGRTGAAQEEIERAAKLAHIHDFIMSLPAGYDTRVGERGIGLSGGQKQRVAIARALLLDSPIIMLDESTSSVDVETEAQIQRAFAEVMKGRTCFIIAQRLSTVRNADKIIVLEHGGIAEEGTHAELLAGGGIYTQIYQMQFKGQEAIAARNGPAEVADVADGREERAPVGTGAKGGEVR
jgi:ABC-type multidrug transport system fused ATPase/permease subunit